MTSSPPGWYPDPWTPAGMRWWDGVGWTHHRAAPAPRPPSTIKSLPFVAAVGAILAIGIPLALSEPVISLLDDLSVPAPLLVVVAVTMAYAPSLWWCREVIRRYGTNSLRNDIGLAMRPVDLGWGPLTWVSCAIAQATVFGLVTAFDVPFESNLQGGEGGHTGLGYKIAFAVVAVGLAPIIEEIAFRGVVLRGLLSVTNPPVAITIQGLLFGAAHFDPVWGSGNIGLVLVLSAAGIVFGAAAFLVKRLAPCMIAHAIVNSIAIAVFFSGWEPSR